MKELLQLYLTFAKIGSVTFGGGYAMLPIIEREIVEKRHWATEDEIADYYALGQCTPGIIAINTSTFVGCSRKGIAGGIAATFGFATPSLIIISIIAALIIGFADYPAVQNAFAGIRVSVCILILNAVISLWKKSVTDSITFLIFLAVTAASLLLPISPVFLVIASGIAGIVINALKITFKKDETPAAAQASPDMDNEVKNSEEGGGEK